MENFTVLSEEKCEKEMPISSNKENLKSKRTKSSLRHKVPEVVSGPRIIMDMAWGWVMDDHTQKKVISQIAAVYATNKHAQKSLPMIFTSMTPEWNHLFERVDAVRWNKSIVTFTEKSLIEIAPIEDIIYLTADSKNVCETFDPTKYYVIGCFIDHNSKKGATADFAKQHGIRTEKLPIDQNITFDGRKVLTVNHVGDLVINVSNGMSWTDALMAVIPPRKNPRPVGTHTEKQPSESLETEKKSSSSFCNVI